MTNKADYIGYHLANVQFMVQNGFRLCNEVTIYMVVRVNRVRLRIRIRVEVTVCIRVDIIITCLGPSVS